MKNSTVRLGVFAAFLWMASPAHAEIEIVLKNDFIATYKNRVTIDAQYTVDKAHPKPNPGSKDGDMHVAGRAPEIQLATVAEIMNAKSEKAAMKAVHTVEGTGQPIAISGAWRIWCEHGGDTMQEQGRDLAPFDTTNPDHVFEIHPISRVGGASVMKSFKPIPGFTPKDAHDAFVKYEGISCRISAEGNRTHLLTTMAGYNYVEFVMELVEDPKPVSDGTTVFANVRDVGGELLVRKRRMVFVKDSPPEVAVKARGKGEKLHVLGIPRVDLALVEWRRDHADDSREPLKWHLPYEIIVVGVYKGSAGGNEND